MKKPIDNLLRLLLCVLLPVAATSAQLKQEREITPHRGYSAPKLINSAELQTMLASAVTDLINAQREKPFKPEEISATVIDLRDSKNLLWADVRGEAALYPASVVKAF